MRKVVREVKVKKYYPPPIALTEKRRELLRG